MGVVGWSGGPCDFSVTPHPNLAFGFRTWPGFGLGTLNLGLVLDNCPPVSGFLQLIKSLMKLCRNTKTEQSQVKEDKTIFNVIK